MPGAPQESGPGGFRPPGGGPGGMMPPGMGSSGSTSDAAPISSSYMTIEPHLKVFWIRSRRWTRSESQNVLLSLALSTSIVSVADIKKGLAQQGDSVPKLPDVVVKLGLETFQGQMKAAGIAVTEFKDSKVVVNAAVGVRDRKLQRSRSCPRAPFIPDGTFRPEAW